jgi:hypothetical protein
LDELNFIDALKLTSILDFKQALEKEQQEKFEEELRNKNGNKS